MNVSISKVLTICMLFTSTSATHDSDIEDLKDCIRHCADTNFACRSDCLRASLTKDNDDLIRPISTHDRGGTSQDLLEYLDDDNDKTAFDDDYNLKNNVNTDKAVASSTLNDFLEYFDDYPAPVVVDDDDYYIDDIHLVESSGSKTLKEVANKMNANIHESSTSTSRYLLGDFVDLFDDLLFDDFFHDDDGIFHLPEDDCYAFCNQLETPSVISLCIAAHCNLSKQDASGSLIQSGNNRGLRGVVF